MSRSRSRITASLVFVLIAPPIAAQVTSRVSVDSGEVQGNNNSVDPAVSADGRFVAFVSTASNLVPGDVNGFEDVFVRDLQSGTTELVSVSSLGVQGNNGSGSNGNLGMSLDGRYVAFASLASNLVTGDVAGQIDIFVRDRQNGTTERVSVATGGAEGNGDSLNASLSADGRFVTYFSQATNLVVGDTNGFRDVFVRDRIGGTTERVSIDTGGTEGNGESYSASISYDGRYVAFYSDASNLVPGDTNGKTDVFVRDRQGLTTERSSVDSGGTQGNDTSVDCEISGDGRYVLFLSQSTNLVPGDTNGFLDVFVRDRVGATTERVSVDSGGLEGNGFSQSAPSISADGRYVVFASAASNLVPGDTNGARDIFLRDRVGGTTERVSLDTGGTQTGGDSFKPTISADGRFVTFGSDATNLVPGDTNGVSDIFIRERGAGTEQETTGPGGAQSNNDSLDASISADDRYLAFESDASNLVAGDTNAARDVFVRDRFTATITLVSVNLGGSPSNGASANASISADGRYVAFESVATDLVVGDTNGQSDVFLRDLQTSATTRISLGSGGAQANGASSAPAIAPGGGFVAFESSATNLVAGDTNGVKDVFVRDLAGNVTSRVSLTTGGVQGNGDSVNASISSNGVLVAFESNATNLVAGDTNVSSDVFVRDRSAVTTSRVSLDSSGTQGAGGSTRPSISGDGRFVAFASGANNFVGGDSNLSVDVFVRDRQLNTISRVSVANDGSQGLMWSGDPSISADGRFVAFASDADNLVSGDANIRKDVFIHDRLFATTRRVSVDSSGVEGDDESAAPAITADGRHVAFESLASNLVIGDTNGFKDTFVRDGGVASAFETFCFGDGTGAPCPCGNSGTSGRGCQNSGSTGGALLTVTGVASLSADTVQFTSSGERPTSLSIFLQGSSVIAPINYGDGLRCTGGNLKRLYTKTAVGGVVVAPQGAELSISARSAQLNAAIPLGATRPYQVYYRDGAPAFCPDPPGSTFNVSNGFLVAWGG